MPIVHFTGFGRTAPAVIGCRCGGFSDGSAQPTVILSESIAGEEFTAANYELVPAKYPRFDTCHHVQADAFFRVRTQIVVAGSIAQ